MRKNSPSNTTMSDAETKIPHVEWKIIRSSWSHHFSLKSPEFSWGNSHHPQVMDLLLPRRWAGTDDGLGKNMMILVGWLDYSIKSLLVFNKIMIHNGCMIGFWVFFFAWAATASIFELCNVHTLKGNFGLRFDPASGNRYQEPMMGANMWTLGKDW